MRRQSSRGFTLIELMVVVLLIGIFAAIAIPQLVENSRSNELTDMTNMVEQTFAEARSLAMKTRRAVVVEMEGGDIWVNRLSGADCWSSVERFCTVDWGQERNDTNDPSVLDLGSTKYKDAKAYLCDAQVVLFDGVDCGASTDPVAHWGGAALCYSGRGELWFRAGSDPNTVCPTPPAVASDDPVGQGSWTRSCVSVVNGTVELNGAVLTLNRLDTTSPPANDCTGDVLDVAREVRVPFGGSPYSEVP